MLITREQLLTTEAAKFDRYGCDRYEIDTSSNLHVCINCQAMEASHVIRVLKQRIEELERR